MDSYDRGVEATKVLRDVVEGRIRPLMALRKPGMLPPTLHVNPPHSGPLVEIFNKAFEMEENPRVINVNICAGFPWSDVPDAGMSVITVVDGDQELADELADELSQRLWEARHEFIPSLLKPDAAVEKAMQAEEGPIVLADVADNPGDGTTQDSTTILESLIRHGAKDAVFAVINDADSLEACMAAGVGGEATLDLGCKARLFGEPVHLTGRVKTMTDGSLRHQSSLYGDLDLRIGRTVVLEANGVEIIITERRNVPMFSELFRRHGIDPSRKKILVVKTFRMHLEPKYGLFAKKIIEVDAPGQASVDMKSFKWTRIPRPMFPID
jgi:microcystin degradation protein MlrC